MEDLDRKSSSLLIAIRMNQTGTFRQTKLTQDYGRHDDFAICNSGKAGFHLSVLNFEGARILENAIAEAKSKNFAKKIFWVLNFYAI